MALTPTRIQPRPPTAEYIAFTKEADAAELAAWCKGTVVVVGGKTLVDVGHVTGDGSRAGLGDVVIRFNGFHWAQPQSVVTAEYTDKIV